MVPKSDEIPQDEKSSLLTRGNKQDGNPNRNRGVAAKPRPQKRRNSDGSLDFERIVNGYSIQAKREQALMANQRFSLYSTTTMRWILTIAVALISGLTTVVIVSATEKLVGWRTRTLVDLLTTKTNENSSFSWYVFGAYCLISLLLADAASALCLYWPGIPEAIGSGIPEVKAYLNGVRVKKFNNLSLLAVKMVGSVLSVGSSMAVGMEGPLVMIGAIVGAAMAHCGTTLSLLVLKIKGWKDRWQYGIVHNPDTRLSVNIQSIDPQSEPILNWLWVLATSDLAYFANDAERRNLITVGAACGFAASFGAPIGGMLFIMDDISSFFEQDMFLRILVANSVGTFCLAYYRGNLSEYGAIEFGSYNGDDDNSIGERFREIPFWVIMGIGGGVMGGWFCKAFGDLKKSSGKKFNTKALRMWRISYVSLINSVVMFVLPMMSWVCHEDDLEDATGAEQQFFCEEGKKNQMATIFFGSRAKAIVRMLSNPGQFYASTLAIVGLVFFVLMLVTNTTAIPSGLFTPIVVSGASLGGAYGLFLKQYFDENIDPSAFALLGVGAMMAGIQRSTVSTCVILVEGTGQMRILLPVMIVVVISNYVAQLIYHDGIYEVLMKLKGYPYLDHSKDDCYDVFLVRDIMSTPPVTLREKERALYLVNLLRRTSFNGFPIVDEHGRFKGLVRRKQIVALMECGIFEKVSPGGESLSKSIFESVSSVRSNSGRNNQGLMHYAYHIKDDRYDHIIPEDAEEEDLEEILPQEATYTTSKWNVIKSALKMKMIVNERKRRLAADICMPAVDISKLDKSNIIRDDLSDVGINAGGHDIDSDDEDDDLSQITSHSRSNSELSFGTSRTLNEEDSIFSSSSKSPITEAPKGFARVARHRKNNVVVISWLNPEYTDDVLDLEAVMNRGTYSVPEHCPLSKAYSLFTLLGLRWIVVVGGKDGGTVVGMLTRESFLDSYLKVKTGMDTKIFQ